jgi:hypothetical protein
MQGHIHDEHGVERTARQVQLNRLAPVNEPRFISMKAATRAKHTALSRVSAIRTLHGTKEIRIDGERLAQPAAVTPIFGSFLI